MSRHQLLLTMGLLITLGGLGLESATAPASPAGGQNPSPPASENPPVVIKTETNLVLVNVIVTDKKGHYIQDLEKKDFHVFEDDAEQTISSYSRESETDPTAPEHRRYMVLFFDDSTMDAGLQIQARQQAGKFVESTASPNRLMAVVDYSGSLKVAQNFTADGERLKRAVSGVKMASVDPSQGGENLQLAAMGAPPLGLSESDLAVRSMLLSMREIAKSLRAVPGRKTLILFSTGFVLTPERQSELTATIDALNKANIAVYPVDVRGVAADFGNISSPMTPGGSTGLPPGSDLRMPESPFAHLPGLWALLAAPPEPEPQRGGAGGGGSAGGTAGGTAGGSSGSSGSSRGGSSTTSSTSSTSSSNTSRGNAAPGNNGNTNPNSVNNNPYNLNFNNRNNPNCINGMQSLNCGTRQIIPNIPDSVATNQLVLYALAKGTGGFVIFNTNDFTDGLKNVAKEMNEYYNLGYTPPSQTHDGSYHKITVKVDRPGVVVRYRNGYYDVKGPDLLKGKPEGKALEERVASQQAGEIPVALSAPYFYVEPGVARVNLALSVPGTSIDFEKQKAGFHSEVNVLGIAYRENGSVAARFSDTVKLDYQKKEIKDFAKGSFNYQNTFNIAPGSYRLKLVLSTGGEKFGKYEVPLVVQPFSGNDLSLEGPALGETFLPVSQLSTNMDAALLEERTPLVFKGMELVPSTTYKFSRSAQPAVYVEVYDPELKSPNAPRVALVYNVIDRKTNQPVFPPQAILVNEFAQPGNPLVPLGLKLPVGQLQAGDYVFEITGRDDRGKISTTRSAEFSVQ